MERDDLFVEGGHRVGGSVIHVPLGDILSLHEGRAVSPRFSTAVRRPRAENGEANRDSRTNDVFLEANGLALCDLISGAMRTLMYRLGPSVRISVNNARVSPTGYFLEINYTRHRISLYGGEILGRDPVSPRFLNAELSFYSGYN